VKNDKQNKSRTFFIDDPMRRWLYIRFKDKIQNGVPEIYNN
jgi:hypothetical protein